ncbi:hypothetical protein [Peptoanaerobacter stomatis]|uniref:hypothetical protein n=1 Tax=Peptoanaerobacter stomatis TaxID=796937 RepID=UPI003F9F121E
MISEEFKSAVSSQNLMRAKIMLKDSLILDPSFKLFDEMLNFAQKSGLINIVVPFDGESLEDDPSKWDKDLMDLEMVKIVNNFSKERIEHLKKIISKVYENKIRNITKEELNKNPQSFKSNHLSRKSNRLNALNELTNNAKYIGRLLNEAKLDGKIAWDIKKINYMEEYALKIIKSIEIYKKNI